MTDGEYIRRLDELNQQYERERVAKELARKPETPRKHRENLSEKPDRNKRFLGGPYGRKTK